MHREEISRIARNSEPNFDFWTSGGPPVQHSEFIGIKQYFLGHYVSHLVASEAPHLGHIRKWRDTLRQRSDVESRFSGEPKGSD
jgi:hypothetical protein